MYGHGSEHAIIVDRPDVGNKQTQEVLLLILPADQ
jgi:hypothetical protein